jgi:hypothetical protein
MSSHGGLRKAQRSAGKEVYNIGYIVHVDPEAGEVLATFDGRSVTYGFGELDALVPGGEQFWAPDPHRRRGASGKCPSGQHGQDGLRNTESSHRQPHCSLDGAQRQGRVNAHHMRAAG